MSRVKPTPRRSNRKKMQDRPSLQTLLLRRARRALRPFGFATLLALFMSGAVLLGQVLVRTAVATARSTGTAWMADMGFRVRHVTVSGMIQTPKTVIEAMTNVHPGMPIFAVSPRAVAVKLEQSNVVQAAVVERLLPDTIRIAIDERTPIAIWQRPDHHFALIGTNGEIIRDRGGIAAYARDPQLLMVVGHGAPKQTKALLEKLDDYPNIRKFVIAAEWIDVLRWNLILKNHTVVRLPAKHVNAALKILETAQTRIALLNRPVQTIDLRLPDRLIVLPYATAPSAAEPISGQAGHL